MRQESLSTRELLSLPDEVKRRYTGQQLSMWLNEQGYEKIVYLAAIEEALPLAVRPALAAHGAPSSAYQGRAIGISLSLLLENPPIAVLPEDLLSSEEYFWRNFCRVMNTPYPTTIKDVEEVAHKRNYFFYPFIGSEKTYQQFKEQTIPPSERFNDKAFMRRLLKQLNLGKYILPGKEIFYEAGEDLSQFITRVIQELKDYNHQRKHPLIIKLANTASGLLSVKYNPEMIEESNNDQLVQSLTLMFTSPYDGKIYPGNVVIEEKIDFGQKEDGFGDFSLRGFITPQGEFVVLSVGRLISNQEGEYLGMVMIQSNKREQLLKIGLYPNIFQQMVTAFSRLAEDMFRQGYFGPVDVDIFAQQHQEKEEFFFHDFNTREGGSTISGLIASSVDKVLNGTPPLLDIELKLESPSLLSEEQLNQVIAVLQENGVFPYATTFLRYPKNEGDNQLVYPLKIMTLCEEALTDSSVMSQVKGLVGRLNEIEIVANSGIKFCPPF